MADGQQCVGMEITSHTLSSLLVYSGSFLSDHSHSLLHRYIMSLNLSVSHTRSFSGCFSSLLPLSPFPYLYLSLYLALSLSIPPSPFPLCLTRKPVFIWTALRENIITLTVAKKNKSLLFRDISHSDRLSCGCPFPRREANQLTIITQCVRKI